MAMSAAAAGALIAGGTAIAGGITSAISKRKELEAQADSVQQQILLQERQAELQRQAGERASGLYSPYSQAGASAVQDILSGEYQTPELERFDYQKDTLDFLDPSVNYQQQQAQRALEESASAGGNLQSGATMRALQNQAQNYAMQDYGNAYNRMTQDKSTAYKQYMDNFNAQRQRVIDNYNQAQGLANMGLSGTSGQANAILGQANQQQNTTNQLSNLSAVQGDINALQAGSGASNVGQAIQQGGQIAGQALAVYNQQQNQPQQQDTGTIVQQGSI